MWNYFSYHKAPSFRWVIVYPIQPIERDSNGVLRFKVNRIIQHLFETGIMDLNKIAAMSFSKEDRQQLAQLLGYSLSGYGDLSYVDEYALAVATEVSQGTCGDSARINCLEDLLSALKTDLRTPMAKLFNISEDDLR